MWARYGRVAAVVVIQLAILAAIPLRQARARLSGQEITLATVPVDPFDRFTGYHVTLRYEVEQAALAVKRPPDGALWLLIRRAAPAWVGAGLSAERPEGLGDGEAAIRVEVERGRLEIPSAGRFYIPEARRAEVEEALRAVGYRALVDMKVGPGGEVALLRLRAGAVTVGAGE